MKRLTKILATIGPSCESEEQIEKMIKAGVNVFRFNFKHNSVEWHDGMIERVNKVAKKMNTLVGILIDLQGPEIRIQLPVEEMTLSIGEKILLDESTLKNANLKGFSITHPEIIDHIKDGQRIVADDGEFEFEAKKEKNKLYLVSKSEGVLKQRKTLNIPGAEFPFPVLIKRDFEGIELAKRREIDFVALSFVRTAEDINVLRKELKKNKVNTQIVSKIETEKALNDLDEIVKVSDGLMVARGDLGVELPFEQVPYYQKLIITKCIQQGKFVITATQMLQSMIQSPLPTRAEVSDVANATYDMSDVVMLSGESASGKYPLRAVNVMRKTLEFNESKFMKETRDRFHYQLESNTGMISLAAYDLYLDSLLKSEEDHVKAFVCFTQSGNTARFISAFRPSVPILALCPDKKTAESLSLNYGVYPQIRGKNYEKHKQVTHNHVLAGLDYLKEKKLLSKGDSVIITHGDYWAIEGGTSTIKLVKVV